MEAKQTSRNRIWLTAERFGNSKSFHSITSVAQFVLDILAWVLAVAIALVMRSYLQGEVDIRGVVQSTLIRFQLSKPLPDTSLAFIVDVGDMEVLMKLRA